MALGFVLRVAVPLAFAEPPDPGVASAEVALIDGHGHGVCGLAAGVPTPHDTAPHASIAAIPAAADRA